MSPKPPSEPRSRTTYDSFPEINGYIGKARALANVVNSLVIAPVVMAYTFLVLSGYVPFRPLDSISADLKHHDAAMAANIQSRLDVDQRVAANITRLVEAVERMERRARLSDCAVISDREIRARCLEVGLTAPIFDKGGR